MSQHNAPHPGGFFLRNIIEPLGLSQAAAARAMDITPATLSRFVKEQADLSPDMAVRLSKVFGQSVEFWMNLQQGYTISRVKKQKLFKQWEPAQRVKGEKLVACA